MSSRMCIKQPRTRGRTFDSDGGIHSLTAVNVDQLNRVAACVR